jgi:hypothetical protein
MNATDLPGNRYFSDLSICATGQPTATILMGGVAVGKTARRKQVYSDSYVLIDAAQIFLDLGAGDAEDFPGRFGSKLEGIGSFVSERALRERRNVVTEIIGDDLESTKALIDALKDTGYKVAVVGVTCDLETSIERSKKRTESFVSAYYAGPINARWILEAVKSLRHSQPHA